MAVIGTILIILAVAGIFQLVVYVLRRLGLRIKADYGDYRSREDREYEQQLAMHGGDASRIGGPVKME